MSKTSKFQTNLLGERLYLTDANEKAALRMIEMGLDNIVTNFAGRGGVVVAAWVNSGDVEVTLKADNGTLHTFPMASWLRAAPVSTDTAVTVVVD